MNADSGRKFGYRRILCWGLAEEAHFVAIVRKLLVTAFVCAGRQCGGPFRGSRNGLEKDVAHRIFGGQGKSCWKICSAIRARTDGYVGIGKRTDKHPLGFEEAEPIPTLEVKRKERRPKYVTPLAET